MSPNFDYGDLITVPLFTRNEQAEELFGYASGYMSANTFLVRDINLLDTVNEKHFIHDLNLFSDSHKFEYIYSTIASDDFPYLVKTERVITKIVAINVEEKEQPKKEPEPVRQDTIRRIIHNEKKDLSISLENLDPNMVTRILGYVAILSQTTGVTTGIDIRPSEG